MVETSKAPMPKEYLFALGGAACPSLPELGGVKVMI